MEQLIEFAGNHLFLVGALVAVLENYQDGAGKVAVPDALRPYMGNATSLDLK